MGSHSRSGSATVSERRELWSTATDPDTLLDSLSARFDLMTCPLPISGRTFSVLAVRDTNKLLDSIDPAVFEKDDRLPFWAELWPSSIELARYCLEDLSLGGRTVLELGCGLGLAGIAAALGGAIVTLSDYEEDALAFARWNILRNLPLADQRARARLVLLNWRTPGDPGQFDVVLGSDIVYERTLADPLLDLLLRTLRPGGMAVLTDPDREPGREFLERARERGFACGTTRTSVEWCGRRPVIARIVLCRPEGMP